jgi:hypothetical protein
LLVKSKKKRKGGNIKNLKSYGFNTSKQFYTVAEIGINHGGDEDRAKKLIDSAVRAGADSVKFQTYLTEKECQMIPLYFIFLSSVNFLSKHLKS